MHQNSKPLNFQILTNILDLNTVHFKTTLNWVHESKKQWEFWALSQIQDWLLKRLNSKFSRNNGYILCTLLKDETADICWYLDSQSIRAASSFEMIRQRNSKRSRVLQRCTALSLRQVKHFPLGKFKHLGTHSVHKCVRICLMNVGSSLLYCVTHMHRMALNTFSWHRCVQICAWRCVPSITLSIEKGLSDHRIGGG